MMATIVLLGAVIWYTACHSTKITAPSSTIVAIMKIRPPNDVGIWAAFSVSNCGYRAPNPSASAPIARSEEHTSELQSHSDLVCRLLLEKKKKKITTKSDTIIKTRNK